MKKITQRQIAEKAGITEQYLSFILNQTRNNISVVISKKLGEASIQLGLPFTPEDWVFRSHLIKAFLDSNNINPANQKHSNKNEVNKGDRDEN